MKNLPTKIYLQIGEDVKLTDDIDFKDFEEVSWCVDRIYKSDIVYYLKPKKVKPKIVYYKIVD